MHVFSACVVSISHQGRQSVILVHVRGHLPFVCSELGPAFLMRWELFKDLNAIVVEVLYRDRGVSADYIEMQS